MKYRRGKFIVLFLALLAFISGMLYISFFNNINQTGINTDTVKSSHNAELEIESALKKLEDSTDKSSIINGVNTGEKVTAITFEGMVDQKTGERLIKLLEAYGVKATFFIPGIKAAEDSDTVKMISKSGQAIGNYTLNADKQMEELSEKEIIENLIRTNAILRSITGKSPALLKCNLTEYTERLLRTAYVSGLGAVVDNNYFLNYQSFPNRENAYEFVKGISRGSIISIKLDSVLDKSEYEKGKKVNVEKPAVDPKPGLNTGNNTIVDKNEKLIEAVGYLLDALQKENYKIIPVDDLEIYEGTPSLPPNIPSKAGASGVDYQTMRRLNSGRRAELITKLYTTQPSVAYVFRGISNRETLMDVLQRLDDLNANATFFVTGKEIIRYRANLDEILKRGHQIANGGYGMNTSNPGSLDFNTACYEIDMGERYLRAYLGSRYSEKANKYYMPLYADAGGVLLEAAKTLGYNNVITYSVSAMSGKYRNMTADQIVKTHFANTAALHRGDIVYFRLDYLTQKGAISDLIYKTAVGYVKKAPYDISAVGDMLGSRLVYVPEPRTQAAGSELIKNTFGYSKETLFSYISGNYIGNPYINTSSRLIGFTDEEISKIDTTGKIETNGKKVIFLTFDDWGYDDNITQLLNVLKKHDAKATFFVRIGNKNLSHNDTMVNPNLLRAIALEGHDIGSHTFSHMQVNISTEEQKLMLQQDLIAANQEIARYVGDTGSLKLFFRPPTLEVSKLGLETVFDCGYEYIINGDFSTHDYEADSVQQLINKMINGINLMNSDLEVTADTSPQDVLKIGPGSIVVMHMSENALYTAEALDRVIPYYLEQGYEFARLSDYLKDGYKNSITKTLP